MTRGINDAGMPINLEGTDKTQLLIIAKHIDRILTPRPNGVVLDRSILDGWAYTSYLHKIGNVTSRTLQVAFQTMISIIDEYDMIFYLPPEIPIASDGQRSEDIEFRDGVVEQFESAMGLVGGANRITTISGTVEQRAQAILDYIKEQ